MGTITESAMTVALATVNTKKEATTFEKQRRCQEVTFTVFASVAGISIDDIPDPFASNYGDVPLLDFQSKEITDLKWIDIGALTEDLKDQKVLTQRRAQTIRAVG